jgi:HlyD family secretion protein
MRAPADAVVTHRLVEPGQLLAAGQNGLTLALTGRLYVRTFIPETKLGRVKHGQAANVTVDSFPGRSFEAIVTEIAPDPEFTPKQVETREERVNLVYGAKVDLMGGWGVSLVPGQPAEIHVQAAAPQTAHEERGLQPARNN